MNLRLFENNRSSIDDVSMNQNIFFYENILSKLLRSILSPRYSLLFIISNLLLKHFNLKNSFSVAIHHKNLKESMFLEEPHFAQNSGNFRKRREREHFYLKESRVLYRDYIVITLRHVRKNNRRCDHSYRTSRVILLRSIVSPLYRSLFYN